MTLGRTLKIIVAIALFCAFALAISVVLGLTDRAITLWERLEDAPVGLRLGLLVSLALVAVGFTVFAWRLMAPRKAQPKASPPALDPQALKSRVSELAEAGADTRSAEQTLATLAAPDDQLDIVLFGAVSTGKSSLAQALLPGAEVEISPLAGSTNDIRRFVWTSSTGATIRIADLPGLEAVGGHLDTRMIEEARRAHVVIFVADSDLTRQQVAALELLRDAGKPMIVSLNKADRYDDTSLATLKQSIHERLASAPGAKRSVPPVLVVTIAGGEQEVLRTDEQGNETVDVRARPPQIQELVLALEELIGGDLAAVRALRQHALLSLAHDQLATAERDYRTRRAGEIVSDTTRKAVVGALAAVTPGTDVIIQGYLGTDLTRRLCRLYGQEARDIEVSRFLDLSQSRVGKVVPITLAIAGNALKAFPGVGTVAGGLVHAVAYGIIFDAVGRGLARSLEQTGALDAERAASAVRKTLEDDLKADVQRIAKLALTHWRER